MSLETETPRTKFDWAVYADATFAGLSILLPIPLLDWAFEWFFRRRMPRTIAWRHGRFLKPEVVRELNRGESACLQSCLLWPLILTFEFLKRLSRKILYFLTVKEASDQLSYYWHRAFLLEHILLNGYVDEGKSVTLATTALNEVLDSITISPLAQLARQIVTIPSHLFRTLRRARRGQEDETVAETKSRMARTWDNFSDYFVALAAQYDETYHRIETQQQMLADEAAINVLPATPEEEKPTATGDSDDGV